MQLPTPSPEPSEQAGVSSETPPSSLPPDLGSLEVVECPERVTAGIGLPMSCGYLTVPENRAEPDAGSIRLFVTRTEPSEGSRVAEDPVLLLGADLGWTPMYAVEVGWRPVDPGLPSSRIVSGVTSSTSTCAASACRSRTCSATRSRRCSRRTPAPRRATRIRVTPCWTPSRPATIGWWRTAWTCPLQPGRDGRRRGGPSRGAGDRVWNIETIGTSSAVAFELLRTASDAVRSVTMDSPGPPQLDMFTTALTGTHSAMASLDEACREDPACNAAYPDVAGTFEAGLRRERSSPSIATGSWGDASIGDAALVRVC